MRALLLGFVFLVAGPTQGASRADPIVASSHLRGGGTAGNVFFLPSAHGTVAVGAAHSFDRTQLAESVEVSFRATPEGVTLGRSRRYFAAPGRAYHAPGATLRDDYLVFTLDAPPVGVRVLDPTVELPARGDRVRIIGLGESGTLPGTVVHSDPERIEIDLEGLPDLRGWGGAPVLEANTGQVIGLLQAAWPAGGGWRVGVGPILGVQEAIAEPFEQGLGRLFSTVAPQPSAANSPLARRRAATGSAHGDQAPERTRAEVLAAAKELEQQAARTPAPPAVVIEHPPAGSQIGDSGTAFLAGHATASGSGRRTFDLVIAIDVSGSTAYPAGNDVDGDGVVGRPRPERGGLSSDPGDSILAAEAAAATRVLAGLDPGRTRVGLIVFGGDVSASPYLGRGVVHIERAALTLEPLTADVTRIERALAELVVPGVAEGTHMAAGVDHAVLELLGLPGSLSRSDPDSQKVVLFFTDGQPTLPVPDSEGANVRAVLDAAGRARRTGVQIYSFAIGPEALAGPISTVEMAAITDGRFTPVRDPGRLSRFVDTLQFARIDQVEVRNETTGRFAHQVTLHADGSWEALVPLTEGENRISVRVRTEDGKEAREERVLLHTKAAAEPPIPAELVARRGNLLRGRLEALEMERIERIRKELVIEIERERDAAVRRSAQMRKELRIEVEQGPTNRPDAADRATQEDTPRTRPQ
ncbi:MAG: VWA domain-containing protein [Deltaproteobacteria bacterium]|nr:VWA domain-containing protein [Deltaproteobacteria bacterium]